MIKINVKTSKNKAFIDGLKDLPKKIEEGLEAEIFNAVTNIADQARRDIRKDLGFALGSITEEAYGLEGRVSVGVSYGAYIEFGTGGDVDVPAGLEEYALKFKADPEIRQVNLPARPFLFPAFRKELPLLEEKIIKLINKSFE